LLDTEKIAKEEKYDGYYSIVTSELNMSDFEIRDTYRVLARIEDTIKISKKDFSSRLVFVRTNEHIDAHFATCYTALALIRLLQARLANKHPIGKVLNSLRKYNCANVGTNNWQFLYYYEILESCGAEFNMKLDNKYRNQLQIKRLLRY
jgi:hypothetical protein